MKDWLNAIRSRVVTCVWYVLDLNVYLYVWLADEDLKADELAITRCGWE